MNFVSPGIFSMEFDNREQKALVFVLDSKDDVIPSSELSEELTQALSEELTPYEAIYLAQKYFLYIQYKGAPGGKDAYFAIMDGFLLSWMRELKEWRPLGQMHLSQADHLKPCKLMFAEDLPEDMPAAW